MGPFWPRTSAPIRLPSQAAVTGLNPSCRGARFPIVPLRPVVLDLSVQALTSLLHFRAFFVPMHQIRTEQIEFVIQSHELTHQFVLHLALHQFIVPSYSYLDFVFHRVFACRTSLISTSVSPIQLTTIAVTRLGAYNGDERLEVAVALGNNLPAKGR